MSIFKKKNNKNKLNLSNEQKDLKFEEKPLVKAEHIYMRFKLPEAKIDTLKERFVNLFKRRKSKYKLLF